MDKLLSLPKKPEGVERAVHFRKKRTKKATTTTTEEAIPMSEQEHHDMLKVAKVGQRSSDVILLSSLEPCPMQRAKLCIGRGTIETPY